MKKVLKFVLSNLLAFILGAVIFGGIGIALAVTGISSTTLGYTTKKNGDITNVEEAINYLYEKAPNADDKNRTCDFKEGTNIYVNSNIQGTFSDNGAFSIPTSDINYTNSTAIINYENNTNNYGGTVTINDSSNISISNNIMNIDYLGSTNLVKINTTGYYKLEVWGAQGGTSVNPEDITSGGLGGYSVGVALLAENEIIYIVVGGMGAKGTSCGCAAGGYNGGGRGTNDSRSGDCTNTPNCSINPGSSGDTTASGGGGGATHIALVNGELSELEEYKGNLINDAFYKSDYILIVAGGGGGASYRYSPGHGGGITGGTNTTSSSYPTQITGYAFGKGQDASGAADSDGVGGGGGGWYGGYMNNVNARSSGTGGSGYIASSRLISGNNITKHMACYGCSSGSKVSDAAETKTIDALRVSEEAKADYAKSGNGYARITFCGATADSCK